jgi:hypothetical protein
MLQLHRYVRSLHPSHEAATYSRQGIQADAEQTQDDTSRTHKFFYVCRCLQAEKTTRKAQLADRLVNGLSGENKRWSETIQKMEAAGGKLVSLLPDVRDGSHALLRSSLSGPVAVTACLSTLCATTGSFTGCSLLWPELCGLRGRYG